MLMPRQWHAPELAFQKLMNIKCVGQENARAVIGWEPELCRTVKSEKSSPDCQGHCENTEVGLASEDGIMLELFCFTQ